MRRHHQDLSHRRDLGSRLHRLGLAILVRLGPLAAGLSLAACSGEPSTGDVEQAIRAELAASQAQAQFLVPAAATVKAELFAAKKVRCSSASNGAGYKRDVDIDVAMPLAGRTHKTVVMRFVKAADGWKVVK